LLQRTAQNMSTSKALEILEQQGLIKPQTRQRYLTPEHLDEDILSVLRKFEREGVLRALPRLSSNDPL
jgi:hypothetical protein